MRAAKKLEYPFVEAIQEEELREQPVIQAKTLLVPGMLFTSSMIMALAWLGHLHFEGVSVGLAILFAWMLVLPEYFLNIMALRMGYGTYTGGQMAAFRLCSGVMSVALVSSWFLGEELETRKILGFLLMMVALAMISLKKPTTLESLEGGKAK